MPTDRRGPGEGRGGPNGGSPRESESSMTSMGEQVREGIGAASDRLREQYGATREEMARRYRRAEGMMARNPAPSVLVAFGVGFGLGLVLTAMLSQAEEETWSDWAERRRREGLRQARHSMRHAQGAVHHAQDAIHQLPEAFSSLADSIRGLPEAIARHMPSKVMGR